MAAGNFDACMPFIFREEGGFTQDRRDPGNWTGGKVGKGQLKGTKFGISAKTYPGEDIARLTRARAAVLYRRDFWNACRCGELGSGVDLVVMDVAVNAGIARGRAYRDGTAALLDAAHRVDVLSEKRRAFYKGLRTFSRYGRAWLSRVARVQAAAIKMVLADAGNLPAEIKVELDARAEMAKMSAAKAKAKAGAAAAGSATGAGAQLATAPPDQAVHPTAFVVLLAVTAGAVIVAILIYRARAQLEVASAFAKAASETE